MISPTLAQAAVLMSIYKPIVVFLVLGGWATAVTRLDKDAAYFMLKRYQWNAAHTAAAAVGFGLWLLVPWFWLGLPLAAVFLGASLFGYVAYRNPQVPPPERWRFDANMLGRMWGRYREQSAQSKATMHLVDREGAKVPIPTGQDPLVPAHQALEAAMNFALPRTAQRMQITADSKQGQIHVYIDGARYPQPALEAATAVGLMDYVKQHAGLDVSERRHLQTGRVGVATEEHGQHTLQVESAGSTRGYTMKIDIDPGNQAVLELDELGLLDAQLEQVKRVVDDEPTGLVLVACPPGQGLTTALYSLASGHDPYVQGVVTLEDKIVWELEGVSHEQVASGADGEAVAKRLNAMLRRDPNVVMLSKVFDQKVAEVIAEGAAETRVYAGMVQPDALSALRVWAKMLGGWKPAAENLRALVAGRLVRRLCATCKAAYKPDPAALKKLYLSPDKVKRLYKASGQVMVKDKPQTCPACMGMGFRGRIGVYEVLLLDDRARELIAAGEEDQLRAHVAKQGVKWLQEVALAKVVAGQTSISEVTRVLGAKESAPSKQTQKRG